MLINIINYINNKEIFEQEFCKLKIKNVIPSEKKLLILSFILLLCSGLLMSQVVKQVKQENLKEDEFYKYSKVFAEVFYEIQNKYVEEVDAKKLMKGALYGMFMSIDPHSQYMGSDSFEQLEKDTEGEFSGIGVNISLRDGILTVIAPLPGTPAAAAGIKSWDRIVEIEGESTEGITIMEAVKRLSGPTGTKVSFKVYRKGETDYLDFTIIRSQIKVESVYSTIIDDTVGYIRLTKFSENTSSDTKKVLNKFQEQNVDSIVIDLRDNSGGLLKSSVEISDYFLEKGKTIVSTRGRIEGQDKVYYSDNKPICTIPIAILVNNGSASASEILAGAIQDNGRGILVGPTDQKTFGKGSVQVIEQLDYTLDEDEKGNPLPNGIRLTTAKYYTPSGRSIHNVGITPDIEVEVSEEEELELAKRGLFGDPEMEEPTGTPNPLTKDKDNITTSSAKKVKSSSTKSKKSTKKDDTETSDSLEKKKHEKASEEFLEEVSGMKKDEEKEIEDSMLNETVRILKAYVIMSEKKTVPQISEEEKEIEAKVKMSRSSEE